MNENTFENCYRNLSLLNMHVVLGEPNVNQGAAMLHEKPSTCYNESILDTYHTIHP